MFYSPGLLPGFPRLVLPVVAGYAFHSPNLLPGTPLIVPVVAGGTFQNPGIGYKQAFFKVIYPFFFAFFAKNKPFGYIEKKLCSIPRKMQFCGYISHFFLKYTQSPKVYLFLPVFVKYSIVVSLAFRQVSNRFALYSSGRALTVSLFTRPAGL